MRECLAQYLHRLRVVYTDSEMHARTHTQCLYTEHDGSVDAVSVSEDGLRILVGTSSVSFNNLTLYMRFITCYALKG